ncbi:MAG: hypothetical protein ACREE9_11770 [Stellaceae bacterium]
MLCLIAAGAAAGCAGKPFLSSGDANSAAVGYIGNLGAATAVAREHCARYERVPRYLSSQQNIAYFACARP